MYTYLTTWRPAGEKKKSILQAFLQATASRSRVVTRYNTDIVHEYECSQHKTTFLLPRTGLELNTEIHYVAMFITVNTNLVDKLNVPS